MSVALRKTHDLVLDRWAVTRTDAFDDAGEQRRSIECSANDFMRARIGSRDPARQLTRMHFARADKRKYRNGIVTGLHVERLEIDRAAVETGRRAGLQTAHRKRQLA